MLKFDGCNTDEQHYQYGTCYGINTVRVTIILPSRTCTRPYHYGIIVVGMYTKTNRHIIHYQKAIRCVRHFQYGLCYCHDLFLIYPVMMRSYIISS